MTYLKIGDTMIEAAFLGNMRDAAWDYRHTMEITCAMTYEQARETFHDGVEMENVYQPDSYVDEQGQTVTPAPEVYDYSDFCRVGSIRDNLDGTVSVKMGEITDGEALAELREVLSNEA